MLTSESIEIDERLDANGQVLQAIDSSQVAQQLVELRSKSIDSLAICLLHAYKNPMHELLLGNLAKEAGFSHVHLSHQVSPTLGMLDRAETTVADAYLGPVLDEFLTTLENSLHPASRLRLMTSAGGLVGRDDFHGKDGILSGPAGASWAWLQQPSQLATLALLVSTWAVRSTDVSRYDHGFDTVYQLEKNGLRLNLPAMAIETVAAGGGSICRFDGTKLTVGPDSAGANPGPACYGHGGPLTVTDMNLFLGRVAIEHFPFAIHQHPIAAPLQIVQRNVLDATNQQLSLEQLALGFIKLANVQMAEAVRSISIRQGIDLRDYALAAFGGAAAQHACELAELLDMESILVPCDGGILSAKGIATAPLSRSLTTPVYSVLDASVLESVHRIAADASKTLSELMVQQELCRSESLVFETKLELRYAEQSSTIILAMGTRDSLPTDFHAAHFQRFGYADENQSIEVVTIRTRVTANSQASERSPQSPSNSMNSEDRSTGANPNPDRLTRETETSKTYSSCDIDLDSRVAGPCLVASPYSCAFVSKGWELRRKTSDSFLLTRVARMKKQTADSTDADPVLLEVFNCRFASIASQMGITLQRTAMSVNVKDRLDFSCALFTADGNLVANAPHVPVHLGAMGETVRATLEDFPHMKFGDVFITNNPFRGGSHLPDITIVTPVFVHDRLEFFVANRAHHAEIGGVKPGSMWAHSTTLKEEGVLIHCLNLAEGGELNLDRLRSLLSDAELPSRSIDANVADVKAQIAANRQGTAAVGALVNEYGLDAVQAYMGHIQMAAAQQMRTTLLAIENGRYPFRDELDDGTPICVAITVF